MRHRITLTFAVLGILLFARSWSDSRYGQAAVHFLRTLENLQSIKKKKATSVTVISKPIESPWQEPNSADLLFQNSTRILWGFWDSGEDAMPGLCQLAVRSWRVRHPDWRIIILSDDNYQDYVSMSDLPSTFESLKVQHRSDILRLAVLVRYGGAYLDVSSVVFKGFDGIWESATKNELFLTAPMTWDKIGMSFANNALIFAKERENPVLREWQRRVLIYSEAPAATMDEMRAHPAFERVAPFFDEPALGILRDALPYCALLWLLTDLLHFDEDLSSFVQENVWILPTRRWSLDLFSLPVMGKKTHVPDDPSLDPPVSSWSRWNCIGMIIQRLIVQYGDDPARAERLVGQLNVIKLSSAGVNFYKPLSYHLEPDTTLSRVYRAALRDGPTVQATLKGATRITLPSTTQSDGCVASDEPCHEDQNETPEASNSLWDISEHLVESKHNRE